MYTIKDLITGEIFQVKRKQDAITLVERRIAIHKSDFYYRHRDRHYPINAICEIKNKDIIIKVEE